VCVDIFDEPNQQQKKLFIFIQKRYTTHTCEAVSQL